MIGIHCFFIFLEVFFYNLLITMVVSEIVYLWFAYYCYMTMYKCSIVTYIVLVALSLTCILRVFDVGIGFNMILYICQLILYAYFGVYVTS